MTDIVDDLVAEEYRLESILVCFDDEQWRTGSGAPGWTVTDVVLHLAQSEEAVVASAAAARDAPSDAPAPFMAFDRGGGTLDEAMDRRVRAERAEPDAVFARWRAARRAAVVALRAADPEQRLQWAAAPLKPRTLATTRLAEHWAHGLDITEPFGIPLPDTVRLRHVAWLAHSSLPYAFSLVGEEPRAVFCELTGPDGAVWHFGDPAAPSRITGDAGAFCRVGAQRLAPDGSGLVTEGPDGAAALRVLRTYAG
jgi:uncharacterized protein (TIGR03084 family)